MTHDLFDLAFEDAPAEPVAIELEPDDIAATMVELEPEPASQSAEVIPADVRTDRSGLVLSDAASRPFVEVLPADFKLPTLIQYCPNVALRQAATAASAYALSIEVKGAEGLQRADLALTALRTSLTAIESDFEEPVSVANALHKRLTVMRAEWIADGKATAQTVGQRIYTEKSRLDAEAKAEQRRRQDEADRVTREAARQEAARAEKAQAPAPVVEELKRQAQTATAPPVPAPASAPPVLAGSTTVTTWKARYAGTPATDDPNPDVDLLTPLQRERHLEVLRAILEGKAPLILAPIDWGYANRRAASDKTAFAIPGLEAFSAGGARAKSQRGR